VNPYYTQPPWEFLLTASRIPCRAMNFPASLMRRICARNWGRSWISTSRKTPRHAGALADGSTRTHRLGEETASRPHPLKTKGVVRPITFWGIVSFRRALPVWNLTFRPRAARFRVF